MTTSPDLQLPDDWPDDEVLNKLASHAVPLFIFAATMVRFLSDARIGSPLKKCRTIYNSQALASDSKLAAAYLPVLSQLIDGQSPRMSDRTLHLFQCVVGPIILLYSPLSLLPLSKLLVDECDKDEIAGILSMLHSVLDIPRSDTDVIQTYHLSFRDFLLDTSLAGSSLFCIDEKTVHATLAKNCIKVMSQSLKRDMCGLRAPGGLAASITQQRLDACIPQEVQYSCMYWVSHAREADTHLTDDNEIYTFLSIHFLHWMEVMALLGGTSEAIQAVVDLGASVQAGSSFHLFLVDAHLFLLNCGTAIRIAPLQLYTSALIFAPLDSVVRRTFEVPLTESRFEVEADINSCWDSCLQTLDFPQANGAAKWVSFSPDDELLAVVGDFSLTIWNSHTGALLHAIKHEIYRSHRCFAVFSPDSRLVASFVDNTLRLLSVSTGHEVQRIIVERIHNVHHCVFSEDGKSFAYPYFEPEDTDGGLWYVVTMAKGASGFEPVRSVLVGRLENKNNLT